MTLEMELEKWFGPLRPCAGRWWESEIRGWCDDTVWHEDGRLKRAKLPLQPINAWTNLAYPLGGLVAIAFGSLPPSLVFFAAMLFLFVGSWLYHAWPTTKTAAIDHAGMYAAFIALTTGVAGAPWFLIALAAAIGAYVFRYAFEQNLNVMMGLFLGLSATTVWNENFTLMLASLVLFTLAYMFWHFDRARRWTGRYGHGLWHILSATALTLMWIGGV